MDKAIVLLSSGLDSTVNLVLAMKEFEVARVLTFDYGQRAAKKEIERSQKICQQYNLKHEVIHLDWLKEISNSSLNKGGQNIPVGKTIKMDDFDASMETAKSVWVPNRNGVFLSIAASFAEAMGASYVIPGFNKEEATTFPDNSKDYLAAMENSLSYSTQYPQVKLKCFTIDMDKKEIVRAGKEVQAPFDMMWPCYFDGDELCGQCESCQRFHRARNS